MPPASEAQRVLEGYAAALGLALAYLMHIAEHPDESGPELAQQGLARMAELSPQACALLAENARKERA